MIIVKLTMPEVMQAAMGGVVRRITSMQNGYDKNKHCEKSDWATDIDGAAAEMAFCKHRKLFWSASNRSFKEPDVYDRENYEWHIRSTNHDSGHLIIRRNDGPGWYVLAITKTPEIRLIGWASETFSKQDEFWKEDSWWIPQDRLNKL